MGEKIKVVIDTNVMVSAFGWHGKPEEILRLVDEGKIINFISIEILDEVRRVISYPKFNFPEALQAEIIETMFSISTIVSINETLNIITEDPPDNRVLECAASSDADFIISGDKHILCLKNFGRAKILTPDDFLSHRL